MNESRFGSLCYLSIFMVMGCISINVHNYVLYNVLLLIIIMTTIPIIMFRTYDDDGDALLDVVPLYCYYYYYYCYSHFCSSAEQLLLTPYQINRSHTSFHVSFM